MSPVISHHDFKELRQKASNAAIYVLMCGNLNCTDHYKIPTTSWSINEEKEWLLNLKCSVCHLQWCVCCTCNNFKVRLVTSRQMLNHKNTHHDDAGVARKRKRKTICDNDSIATDKNAVIVIEKEATTVSLKMESTSRASVDDDPIAKQNDDVLVINLK